MFFDITTQLTTCAPVLIGWAYSGPSLNMTLTITATNASGGVSSGNQQSTFILSTDIDPTLYTFYHWPLVNVSQGWYMLFAETASNPTFIANSSAIFVRNGSDVSCVAGSPMTSLTETGMIVGAVTGGLCFLVIVIALFLGMYCQRRKGKITSSSGTQRRYPHRSISRIWDFKCSSSPIREYGNSWKLQHYHPLEVQNTSVPEINTRESNLNVDIDIAISPPPNDVTQSFLPEEGSSPGKLSPTSNRLSSASLTTISHAHAFYTKEFMKFTLGREDLVPDVRTFSNIHQGQSTPNIPRKPAPAYQHPVSPP
ncbi:hypothetical protein BDQ12DRAFT_733005 [Crucibulum laeve]|uniref:Mid2 domain-containing protein n=1 Tax=Crucibulum laeve TaxID=68775 RepID=A0A5C3MC88_9AGAR|nr:hypothetical protein BDQ12DRAFT_733005 [Crucibulum laeve]